jgi:chemotaxis protein CheX
MNTTLINPALESLHAILFTLANTDLTAGPLATKDKHEFICGKSITGVMHLTSNQAQASIVIIFPESSILRLANKIMPEPVERIDALVIDLVGEITNMVSGGVKRALENEGYLFDLSLPTIIMGTRYLIAYLPEDAPIIVSAIATAHGDFFVEASFKGSIDFCPLNLDNEEEMDDLFF